jgi:putative hemolysin
MVAEIFNHDICENNVVISPRSETAQDNEGLFGRIGTLETRLARNEREIDAAQSVRYRVFVEEMKARLPAEAMRRKRDFDAWDSVCDHLLVLDKSIEGDSEDQIVGTYRLLRQETALANNGSILPASSILPGLSRAIRASASWNLAVPVCCRNIAPSVPSSFCGRATGLMP